MASEAPARIPWRPIRTLADAFRFLYSESPAEINERAGELEQLLDEGLAVALAKLLKRT